MKKICHFSSVHKGLDVRIFRKECVSLANAGYDTHLVIRASEEEVAEAAECGVTVHPLPFTSTSGRLKRISWHAWNCYRTARDLDADLYHFHDPELIPYGLLLIRAGKRVIFDVHEDLAGEILTKDWVPLYIRRPLAAVARAAEYFSAHRLSAVVTATPFIGSIFNGKANRVEVINNYPLLNELPLPGNVDAGQRSKVCYVGGIHPQRGIREMVKAIELSGDELLLAGDFPKGRVRDEISQCPGWSKVREYGVIDRAGVSNVLAQSFAGFVILYPEPNFINSQPIKMFEYMSAGVPVIASDFPLWRQIIDENQCGICVDQSNPEVIAAAVRYLRSHPEDAARMGMNGRNAVFMKYRWDKEEKTLLALYRSLLNEDTKVLELVAARQTRMKSPTNVN